MAYLVTGSNMCNFYQDIIENSQPNYNINRTLI